MADLVRFVDSIVASPTVRLDLNGEATNGWYVRSFSAPAPRLRRSMSSNAMRDGINVGSSSYDARTLTLELECIKADQDSAATELQKLARELDRETNFLMYQPEGATKPVFFKTFRSELGQIDDVLAQKAMRRFTIELLAEPFALGLRETLGPFTVNSDPAAASNGCYFDVTGVLGDVAVPMVWQNTSRSPGWQFIAVRQHGTPADLVALIQAEDTTQVTPDTDTSNPGGGPDAAMSGTGTNNYLRTTFATNASMAERLSVNVPNPQTTAKQIAIRGTYRCVTIVRRSSDTGVITLQAGGSATGAFMTGKPAETALTTSRQIVDLGLVSFGEPVQTLGHGSTAQPLSAGFITLSASRTSGTSTLDWDFLCLLPADEAQCMIGGPVGIDGGSTYDEVIDGVQGRANVIASGNPVTGIGVYDRGVFNFAGSLPVLLPGQTNRIYHLAGAGLAGLEPFTHANADTNVITISYWPQYLFVRPAAS